MYPEIQLESGTDVLVARADLCEGGGFEEPCWRLELNGTAIPDIIPLVPHEPLPQTEHRVRVWLEANRARFGRGSL